MKKKQLHNSPGFSKSEFPEKKGKRELPVWLQLLLIIGVGIVVYANSFNNSFHFDDLQNIVNNTYIRTWPAFLSKYLGTPVQRTVSVFTFALNYQVGQLNVWGYHLVNILIHLINSLIVYTVVILLFSTRVMFNDQLSGQRRNIALFTALIFIAHPLATSAVTYIVQRMAILATLFYLLSIVLYIKARIIKDRRHIKMLLFLMSGISGVLALYAKENAITLPVALILLEIVFFIENPWVLLKNTRIRIILIISAVISFIFLFEFSDSLFKTIPPWMGHNYTLTPGNYLLTQFSVIVKYIQLLIVPVNQTVDYDFPIAYSLFEARTFFSLLFLLSLLSLAAWLLRKHRIIAFGIFWFFITLSIESSIIPISDVIFEHRTYLPSVGFILMLVYAFFLFSTEKRRSLSLILLSLVVMIFVYLSIERNKVWKDDITLWSDAIAKAPNKPRPHSNRGLAYMQLLEYEKAIADYSNAIRVDPDYKAAYYDRGVALEKLGQPQKAIDNYLQVIRIDSTFEMAYGNLGSAALSLNQSEKAIVYSSKAIILNPEYSDAYYNRGNAYARLGFWDKSLADLSQAIRFDPEFARAYSTRSAVFSYLGKHQQALNDMNKAIELDPQDPVFYYNRAIVYGNLNLWKKAIDDYSKTLEINPGYTAATNNRNIAIRKLESILSEK